MRIFLWISIFIFSLTLSYFVGQRDLSIGVDSLNYYNFFMHLDRAQVDYVRISEPFFVAMTLISLSLSSDYRYYFSIISFFSFFSLSGSYFRILDSINLPSKRVVLLTFTSLIILILIPFFWAVQLNVLRVGLSVPFIFLAINSFSNKKNILGFVYFIIAGLFHYSAFMYFFIYIIRNLFYKNFNKYFYKIFYFIFFLYIVGLNRIIFESFQGVFINYNLYSGYIEGGGGVYKSGIRYDFILFSLVFLVLIYFVNIKNNNEYLARFCMGCHILVMPFLFFGHLPFSDRLLLPFWLLIPIILTFLMELIFYKKIWFNSILIISPFLFCMIIYFSLIGYSLI